MKKFTFMVSLLLTMVFLSASQKSTIPPSEKFITELKEKNGCSDGKSDHLTHCYYLENIDFGEYEPISYKNAFTSYKKLFDLGEYDEIKFERNIYESETKYRKEKFGKHYKQYHKGFPVVTKHFECTLELDSNKNRIIRSRAFIIKNLDVDTTVEVSEKEALKIAKSSVSLDKGEHFSWEIWKGKYDENEGLPKKWFEIPKSTLKIFEGKLSHVFDFTIISKNVEILTIYIDAKNGEVLYQRIPDKENHLCNHSETKRKPDDYLFSVKQPLLNKINIESEVEYSMKNPSITGNNEYLEFDIYTASLINNEKFFRGEVFVEYNSLTFGTNIASSGKITLSKGTVISAPNYTISIIDISPDLIKIVAESNPTNPNNYYTLTSQSEQLLHFKIDISNLSGNTDIEFEQTSMQGLSEFFNTVTANSEPFDVVTALDEIDIDISGIILSSGDSCQYCNGIYPDSLSCAIATCGCSTYYNNFTEGIPTYYYGCQDISMDSCNNGGIIRLSSTRPNENILIYDASGLPNNPPLEATICYNDTIILLPEEIIESNALYCVEKTGEYFALNTTLGLNSYNDQGSVVPVFTHDKNNLGEPTNSAIWSGYAMQLGDGIQDTCNPMVSLDVVSHEYTHKVLEHYAKLIQDSISGLALKYSTQALHESLCDIFSYLVRRNTFGFSSWDIGNESCWNKKDLPRLFDDPMSSRAIQAAYYKDVNAGWDLDSAEYYNRAGVITYWFYLLSQGGTGFHNDAVSGVGIDKAEEIILQTIQLMRVDTAHLQYSFEGFRDLTLSAAILLYTECSAEHESVAEAWKAVGLLDCDSFEVDLRFEQFGDPDTCKPWMIVDVSNGSGCYFIEWFQMNNLGQWVFISNNSQFKAADCGVQYKVVVNDDLLGCTDGYELFVDTREVNKINENLFFRIRPTLATQRVFFDLEVKEPTEVTIRVFDQLGRLVSIPMQNERLFGMNTIEQDISNLANGLYFVSIETPKRRYTKKFVKM